MARALLISEVLKNTSKLKTKKERMAYLKEHDTPALRDIIRINYDGDVVSLVPEGTPPYKKDDAPDGHNFATLHKRHREFVYFFKGQIFHFIQFGSEINDIYYEIDNLSLLCLE